MLTALYVCNALSLKKRTDITIYKLIFLFFCIRPIYIFFSSAEWLNKRVHECMFECPLKAKT
jgi:hypothetical protein